MKYNKAQTRSALDIKLHIRNLHCNKASVYNDCLMQQGVSTAANAINDEWRTAFVYTKEITDSCFINQLSDSEKRFAN